MTVALFTILTITSCDEPFQPFAENDSTPLSIYGYLDASADTQWVRVTPVRDRFDMPAEKPDMLVTLEHLESIDDIIYALPELFSNVENGLGYLVGIVSKTIPWMSCFEE